MNIFETLWKNYAQNPELDNIIISDTIVLNQNIQWYFYSYDKKRILRKKKQNCTKNRLLLWIENQFKSLPKSKSCFLLVETNNTLLHLKLLNIQEVMKQILKQGQKNNRTLISLLNSELQESILNVYWTNNYCLCESQSFANAITGQFISKQYNPLLQTKQLIAQLTLKLSKILNKNLQNDQIKQMGVIYLKQKSQYKPLLIAVTKIKTEGQKMICNYQLQKNNKFPEQIYKQNMRGNKAFLCSVCKGVNSIQQAKKITKNSVQKTQIRNHIRTGKSVQSKNNQSYHNKTRLFFENYQEVNICNSCFNLFEKDVKKQQINLQKPQNICINYLSNKLIGSKIPLFKNTISNRLIRKKYVISSSRNKLHQDSTSGQITTTYTNIRTQTQSFSQKQQ